MKPYVPRNQLTSERRRQSGVAELRIPPHIASRRCESCVEDSTYCVHKRKDGAHTCENCFRKKNVVQIAKNRQWLWDLKASSGCVLCSEDDPSCLDYHHLRPSKKKFSIGSVASSIPDKAINIEIRKCVVLCANCHRKVEIALGK